MKAGQCHEGPAFAGVKEARSFIVNDLAVEPTSQEVPSIDLVRSPVCAHDDPNGTPFVDGSLIIRPWQEIGVLIHAEYRCIETQTGVHRV